MEAVMHKIENMENAIKETEANVKILNNDAEINSKQNVLILEQLGTIKEDVKNLKEEQNANHNKLNLEQCVEKYSNKTKSLLDAIIKSVLQSFCTACLQSLIAKPDCSMCSNCSA